ncbi:S8 family serine peptidase [Spirillospora sp. CA-253888]
MRGTRLLGLASAVTLGALTTFPAPVAHAAPAAKCEQPRQAGHPRAQLPKQLWPQERLNFTEAWALTRGKGVRVAVLDSGVDASHPQLRGRVHALDVTGTGLTDCVGHGTSVTGIIGARDLRAKGVPFLGVAPEAQLISIKVATGGSDNNPKWAPLGIRKAADLGARVINTSFQSLDYAELRTAVQYAQRKGAIIVAAAGNTRDEQKQTEVNAYPASYPGVIAVGALNQDGSLATFSNKTTPVTVTAPGQNVVSTWPEGTYHMDNGTSQAAPYVTGTIALMLSYHPKWTPQQVLRQIQNTADGATAQGTGSGVVNAQRAVTTTEVGHQAAAAAAPQRVTVMQPPKEDRLGKILAFSIAGATLVAAAGIGVGALVIPAARRRAAG